MKRTPLKGSSQKQALLNARWLGMKDMKLYMLKDEALCGLCHEQLFNGDTIDADHITARSRGGTYDPDNLQLVHRRCHADKHNRTGWSANAD